MIFDEGVFIRTLWYGRSRIWQKTRKYRGYGGFKRNHLWLPPGGNVADVIEISFLLYAFGGYGFRSAGFDTVFIDYQLA